jgi:hypothetical protein
LSQKAFHRLQELFFLIERFISYIFYFHNLDREGPGKLMFILYCTKVLE